MFDVLPVHTDSGRSNRNRFVLLLTKVGGRNKAITLEIISLLIIMADVIYNSFKRDIANGSIDLDTDTIKVLLVSSSYTPDQDTHTKRSDITNELSAGSGYTSGGETLAGKSVTVDNTNNRSAFDANDVTWTTATFTARGAVLYKSRGGVSSADELIAYIDFGTDKSVSGGNFVIQWGANGILLLT